jgi:Lon protease-like protein
MQIPLFPLNTVLFPGGTLALRIFEPRYMRMVSDCLKGDAPFGVCLIRSGSEVGTAAKPYRIGTLARIVDWEQRPDGLLGITARGERRFSVGQCQMDAQQLQHAEATLLDEAPPTEIGPDFQPLVELLQRIIDQLGGAYAPQQGRDGDAGWVGYRLAELLPLPLRDKQRLLEVSDPIQRLRRLHRMLQPDPPASST